MLSRFAFIVMLAVSAGAWAQAGRNEVLDPKLVDYTRIVLNLSLCVVAFEEEYKDVNSASRYQNGVVRTDLLMRQGGWDQEEWFHAHEAVLQEDFSFTLSPDTSWSSFQKEHFTSEFCDEALAQIDRVGE